MSASRLTFTINRKGDRESKAGCQPPTPRAERNPAQGAEPGTQEPAGAYRVLRLQGHHHQANEQVGAGQGPTFKLRLKSD